MPKDWRKEQSQDYYFRKSKSEGYRARSAYKLMEINEKFHLIRPGATILDLGAAPGSWSQAAQRIGGNRCKIVAVDIQEMQPIAGVHIIQCDITQPQCVEQIKNALPKGADVVLSDVSPRISGIAQADHARSIELSMASLNMALRFLKKGGAFVVKVFQGEDFNAFVAEVRQYFESVRVFHPAASRSESKEVYVVGLRMKARDVDQRTGDEIAEE